MHYPRLELEDTVVERAFRTLITLSELDRLLVELRGQIRFRIESVLLPYFRGLPWDSIADQGLPPSLFQQGKTQVAAHTCTQVGLVAAVAVVR